MSLKYKYKAIYKVIDNDLLCTAYSYCILCVCRLRSGAIVVVVVVVVVVVFICHKFHSPLSHLEIGGTFSVKYITLTLILVSPPTCPSFGALKAENFYNL